jgi:hypothetical protein
MWKYTFTHSIYISPETGNPFFKKGVKKKSGRTDEEYQNIKPGTLLCGTLLAPLDPLMPPLLTNQKSSGLLASFLVWLLMVWV